MPNGTSAPGKVFSAPPPVPKSGPPGWVPEKGFTFAARSAAAAGTAGRPGCAAAGCAVASVGTASAAARTAAAVTRGFMPAPPQGSTFLRLSIYPALITLSRREASHMSRRTRTLIAIATGLALTVAGTGVASAGQTSAVSRHGVIPLRPGHPAPRHDAAMDLQHN